MKYLHTVGTLSATIQITETEKNPKFVKLDKNKFICASDYFCVRKTVAQKLNLAKKLLPMGYTFKIYETYRSQEKQMKLWQNEVKKIKTAHPNWPIEKVYETANEGIANPNKIGSGHQTGGAVDITLCYNDKEVDMGSPYLATDNPKTKTICSGLTKDQWKHRKLLSSVMSMAGLINYPLEWWHYSYGEHEWAVLAHQKKTHYTALKDSQITRE